MNKYEHVKTPDKVLDFLHSINQNTSTRLYKIRGTDAFITSSANSYTFIQDSIRYKDEIGDKIGSIPFSTYFPTFDSMDSYQRRFYFYWRNQAVHQNFIHADLSYIFLFTYELINYSFDSRASFNIYMLEQLYKHYISYYPKLFRYLPGWIADMLLEADEHELANEWLHMLNKRRGDEELYNKFEFDKDRLDLFSMNIWKLHFNSDTGTPFLTKNKNKIYNMFKKSINFLQNYTQQINIDLIDSWFPNTKVRMRRKTFTSALLFRENQTLEYTIVKRIKSRHMYDQLTNLFRLSENIVKMKSSNEDLLDVDSSHFPDGFMPAYYNEFLVDKNKTHLRFIQVKGHLGQDNNNNSMTIEQRGEQSQESKFSINRFIQAGGYSKQNKEEFNFSIDDDKTKELYEQSVELEKIIGELDDEIENDPTEENKVITLSHDHDNKLTQHLSISEPSNSFEQLFSSSDEYDFESFVDSLSNIEINFIKKLEEGTISIDSATSFLKSEGIMFGTFLIELNEKAEEYLDDVLIEESDGDVILSEDFMDVFNFLKE